MKKIFLCIIILSMACADLFSAENTVGDGEIPVITIEPMLDRIGWYMSHKAYTFQTRLSAELFTRWKCHISARNIGLLLHQERSLSSLEKQLAAMPSPQWIVGGSYQKGRRMNGKWSETDIELLLINAADGALQRDVFREKAGRYKEARFISDHIAKKLKLSPRKVATSASVNKSKKFSGTDYFVYQIQQSGKLKNIVSRENIDKIFAEHKLQRLNNIDAGSAAGIGRLLSADRIIYGMVTNGEKKGIRRLDILAVDCNSGVVVNAFTGTFTNETQESELAKAAVTILNVPDLLPPTGSGKFNAEAIDIESKRLLDVIRKSRFQYRSTSVLSGQILSLAESYFLLNSKDHFRCLVLAHELVWNLYFRYCPEHWYHIYSDKSKPNRSDLTTTEEQSKMAANFLLPILDRLRYRSIAEYNDSIGRLKFRLLVNAGRCDEAEAIWRNRADGGLVLLHTDCKNVKIE